MRLNHTENISKVDDITQLNKACIHLFICVTNASNDPVVVVVVRAVVEVIVAKIHVDYFPVPARD